MKRYTVMDILELEPCSGYTKEEIKKLWKGRKDLSCRQILNLDISGNDKEWFVIEAKETIVLKYKSGNKEWYKNGELHRENGPAIEWSGGNKDWYVNGQFCEDKEEFKEELKAYRAKQKND